MQLVGMIVLDGADVSGYCAQPGDVGDGMVEQSLAARGLGA
jgi:hypothetical protein